MSREWKPGDVALWVGQGKPEVIFRFLDFARDDDPSWQTATEGHGYPLGDDLRPLVVIDPEDVEQVEQLADIFCAVPSSGWVKQMQAALREFANPTPPKPEEPTRLGALIADEHGQMWTRDARGNWRCLSHDLPSAQWEQFPAVRVLSPGVTPEEAS